MKSCEHTYNFLPNVCEELRQVSSGTDRREFLKTNEPQTEADGEKISCGNKTFMPKERLME